MASIEEYYEDFMNQISLGADSGGLVRQSQFFHKALEFLTEDGIVGDDCIYSEYISADKSMRVDGYHYEENRGILNLIIVDFEDSSIIESLDKSVLGVNFKKVERFFKKAVKKDFYNSLEPTTEGYELAKLIHNNKDDIAQVNVILLSNKILKTRLKKLEENEIEDKKFIYDIWDIERFYNSELSKGETESIEIDFLSEFQTTIPALKATLQDTAAYSSFLCVVSGDIVASLYEKYGSRLLEQNVRSFLQFKGGINKGIRRTIKENPEMFFAYNNGITATADHYELDEVGNIIKLKNLQIVNGGQTTASLYTAKKVDKVSLASIFVQMKLSVIPEDKIHEVVPNISKFANSQNKVSDSDLFANHPFHRRMEEKSRRILAPKAQGELKQTKWFYERARGQYLEEQSKLTEAKKKEFKELYPKTQLITKPDLAKVFVLFELHPYKAVQGAQIVFKYFAEKIVSEWEKNDNEFNDVFYQFAIAKTIIFRTTQEMIAKNKEFRGQDRAIIVAYTISSIAYAISKLNKSVDFEFIWKKQAIGDNFRSELDKVGYLVNDYLLIQTGKNGMTVLSYSKTQQCWDGLRSEIDKSKQFLDDDFLETLIDKSEYQSQLRGAKKEQAIENEVNMQKMLFNIPKDKFEDMKIFGREKSLINSTEEGCLDVIIKMFTTGKPPSEKQMQVIGAVVNRLFDEGFEL